MTETTVSWKVFYFESNLFFDHVRGPEDWLRLRKAYHHLTDNDFLSAKEATHQGTRPVEMRRERPQYGFGAEHDGSKTLRDFIVENNMLDQLPPYDEPRSRQPMAVSMVEAVKLLVLRMQSIVKQNAESDDEKGYADSAKENRAQYWTLNRVLEGINDLLVPKKPASNSPVVDRLKSGAQKRVSNPAIDSFLADIVEVCKQHGLSLSHEDHHGAFEVEEFDEGNIEWLLEANDATQSKQ